MWRKQKILNSNRSKRSVSVFFFFERNQILCPSIFNVGLARVPCCGVLASVPADDVVTDNVEVECLLEKFEFVLVLLSFDNLKIITLSLT